MGNEMQMKRGYRVTVAGVGGAGGKAINQMLQHVKDGPMAVVFNTDSKSLAESLASSRTQIGITVTKGLGTGGDPGLGRISAENDMEMIQSVFTDTDIACIVAGLGGGTGTGATPEIVRAARDAGAMTLCFVTMPFKFEGEQRRTVAEQGLIELQEGADAVIVVSNDRLFEIVGSDAGVAEAFKKADEIMASGICAICQLITKPGFINLDFADLQKVVHHSGGACTFGYAEWGGRKKAKSSIKRLLEGPMLDRGEVIAKAGSLLVSIVGGHDLTLRDVEEVMSAIGSSARKDAHILMGTVIDEAWKGKGAVTIVAAEQWNVEYEAVEHEHQLREGGEKQEELRHKPRKHIKRVKRDGDAIQTVLHLEENIASKGCYFKDVDPTILDGEDIDIPTFKRRSIRIEK